MNLILKLRNNNIFVSYFAIFVLGISALAVSLLIGRIFIDVNPIDRFLVTIFYFTTQSNILILIIMVCYILKQKDNGWFQILSLIGLIDILITSIFFHLFLASYLVGINMMQHLLHTGTPLLYLIFYFVIIEHTFRLKDAWIGLIHPIIFVISVYTWIHPIFGDTLAATLIDFQGASYVYPFMDPSTYQTGITGLLLFDLGILTPFVIVLSILVIYLKSSFELRITK
ncbi:MAG: hypothetical protein ABH890_01275 [Bacillota bacterium]